MNRSSRLAEQQHDRHNHQALAQLLAHIREQRDQQCSVIHAESEQEGRSLVEAARARAAGLLREARKRERAAENARLRAARTQQRGRVRTVWLKLRSELARRGLASLDQELQRLWREDPRARRCWLHRALREASWVLPGGRWVLEYPRDTGPEGLDGAINRLCPGVSVEPRPCDTLVAGFRVRSGNAAIDLTPAGLLARRNRIVGQLLAKQAAAPPELDS